MICACVWVLHGYPVEMTMLTYVVDCKYVLYLCVFFSPLFFFLLLFFYLFFYVFVFYSMPVYSLFFFSLQPHNPQKSKHILYHIFTFSSCITPYIVFIHHTNLLLSFFFACVFSLSLSLFHFMYLYRWLSRSAIIVQRTHTHTHTKL